MIRKIVSLLLAVGMLSSMALLFAGCDLIPGNKQPDEPEHTHTFSENWSFDETEHWHAATCEHSLEKSDVAKHGDYNYDGVCDTCGYAEEKESDDVVETKVRTYIITVTDASGSGVGGVDIILISEEGFYTAVKTTNNLGRVSFELEEGEYVAALAAAVEGYSNTVDDRYEITNRQAKIVLQ